MRSRTSARARTALAISLLVLAAACGGGDGGGGDDGDDDQPEPSANTATVSGGITVNGETNVGNVGLVLQTEDTSGTPAPTGAEEPTPTEPDGSFSFSSVEPGTYVLIATTTAYEFDIGSISFDGPCTAEGFEVLNAPGSDPVTGEETGILLLVKNEETPLQLEAGDQITVDVAIVCEP